MTKNPKNKYEKMVKGQKAARIGLDSEKDIVNAINNDEQFREQIRGCLENLGFNSQGNIKSYKKSAKTKSDIFIDVGNYSYGVSIKSSDKTSFHQTDRRRLEKWRAFLNMPEDIYQLIKGAIMRIANDPKAKFILEEDKKKIHGFFCDKYKVSIKEVFTRSEKDLVLFLVNNKMIKKIYLYKMDEVLDFLNKDINNNIQFSKKGIIYLGNYVSIQRKSGNGKHVKIPKTNYAHPGNDLQFKFSPLKFAKYISDYKSISSCTIDYNELEITSNEKKGNLTEFL